jgi:hypothetical protein
MPRRDPRDLGIPIENCGAARAGPLSLSAAIVAPLLLRPGHVIAVHISGFPAGVRVRLQLSRHIEPACNCDSSTVYPIITKPGLLVPSSGSMTIGWRVPERYAQCVATFCEHMRGNLRRFKPGQSVVVSASTAPASSSAYAQWLATIG